MENQRLKEELAEYKRKEKEAALSQEQSISASEQLDENLDIPNANFAANEIIKG